MIKYRVGACTYERRSLLEAVLASEPRYAEAHLSLGHYALMDASRGRGRRSEVVAHLVAAYDAFPQSPSVTIALAGMYRALVRSEQKRWTEAAAAFPRAATCYGAAALVHRAQLEEFRKGSADTLADDAAEALGERERRVEEARLSQARAYDNAAYASAQEGDRARGIEYAEHAAAHAAMKAKADELAAALRRRPQ